MHTEDAIAAESARDALRSAKLIHRTLLLACAALIGFGLSPDPAGPYRRALEELEFIDRYDERTFPDYVDALVRKDGALEELPGLIRSLVSERGIELREAERVSYRSLVYVGRGYGIPSHSGGWNRSEESLNGLYPLFNDHDRTILVVPNREDLLARLTAVLAAFEECEEVTISDLLLGGISATLKQPRINRPGDQKARLELLIAFRNQPCESPQLLDQARKYFALSEEKPQPTWRLFRAETTLPVELREIPASSFVDWLKADPATRFLVSTEEVVFPALQSRWDEFRDLTYPAAARHARDQLASTQGKVSFLGLPLEEAVVAWFPIFTTFLLLYLMLHLAHAARVVEAAPVVAFQFPWLSVLPGLRGRVLSILTVVVIPLLADLVLVRRLEITGITLVMGVIVVAATLAFGWSDWRLLERVRRLGEEHAGGDA